MKAEWADPVAGVHIPAVAVAYLLVQELPTKEMPAVMEMQELISQAEEEEEQVALAELLQLQ
jgi:hypothetical protein